MTEAMSPYLVPSCVIGVGGWGGDVARGLEAALKDRSPALARACPVLTIQPDDPAVPERIRAHLRVSRMAEVIRALEQERLMQLDPVISPTTYVYLVVSREDDADLSLLRHVADLVEQAAAELKATVSRVALVDLGAAAGPVPAPWPFPVYVLEPVTSHGLVLDAAEYTAAAVEVLVAAAQPGGAELLTGARAGAASNLGTLGIAWLAWSPAVLRGEMAHRLTRDALQRCLQATAPATSLRTTPVGEAQSPAVRELALMEGVPFCIGPHSHAEPTEPLFLDPMRRRKQAPYLRRCAAVLERKGERWRKRIERNAARQAIREGEALERTLQEALTAGPNGLARVRAVAEAMAREAQTSRRDPQPVHERPLKNLVLDLERAEGLPELATAAAALGVGLVLFTMIWWLAGGSWLAWLGGLLACLLAAAAYSAWRSWRVKESAERLRASLHRRAAAWVDQACAEAMDGLDQTAAARAEALLADLARTVVTLEPSVPRNAAPNGALWLPLVGEGAADLVYREIQPLAPEAAEYLAAEGCLLHFRDRGRLHETAHGAVERFLAGRGALEPAQLATRAYGDRLAERLHTGVRGLLDWAQPLLARTKRLPEGQRWLLWPDGLPCPPVPPEVQVIPFARSCAAALTVIRGIDAGILLPEKRTKQEHSA